MRNTPITQFITHDDQVITGQQLINVLNQAADAKRELAQAIYLEDAYADHVTKQTKQDILARDLKRAELVRTGVVDNLTDWQRINTLITGECIALLPNTK